MTLPRLLARVPRRQRFLLIAGAGAAAFVLLTAAGLWRSAADAPAAYRPGEATDGLSARLEREVPADAPRVTFTDVTEEAGIRFHHFSGQRTTRLPEDMGSGAAWGDYDNDGWPDLYVVNQAGPLELSSEEVETSHAHAALYHNRGDGTFEERAEAAGVAFRGTGMAAAWADYDSDGWIDLLVTSYGGLVLYRNRGDGTFADVTSDAGLGGFRGFWAGVAWADYDRDGDLDAYVAGYVQYLDLAGGDETAQYDVAQPASLNPSTFPAERNLLLRNEGDGTFREVATHVGVADPHGRSLSAAWADLDDDGWVDLYVANDLSDNRLFRNLGEDGFEEISHSALVADYRGSMGIAIGDWDGDRDLDLFLTHWVAQENALYTNQRSGSVASGEPEGQTPLQFMDEADLRGLGQVALDFVGWGTSFFDYDNDGRLDLLVANGSTLQRQDDHTRLVPMRNQLFWNGGPRRGFFEVSTVAGPHFGEARVGRGAAFADYDRDGDVDVFLVSHGDRGVLLRNDAPGSNGWLQVELEGRDSNRSALGARLTLTAGGISQVREVGSQASYLSQNSLVEHFGLATATSVDTLEVRWPSGAVQRFADLPARSRVRLVEGGIPVVTMTRSPARVAEAGGEATGSAATADEKARVRAFWRHFREATAARVAGRLQDAVGAYSRALALEPDHEDALYYLGSVLIELGRYDDAREPLERLVAVNPRSGRGHARLGTLHLCRVRDPDPRAVEFAEVALRRAAALNPEATGNYIRLAEVALVRQDPAAATTALETVLGSDPGSGPARFLLGYIAWRDGRSRRALELFRSAVGADGSAPALASAEGDTRESQESRRITACSTLPLLESWLHTDRAVGADELPRLLDRRYTELLQRLGGEPD
jgi:tetratricopeptide (TPR) repeat protein